MLNKTIQNTGLLVNELISGYVQSKYDKKYLEEKINKILEIMLPGIASLIKNKEEKELIKLWDTLKDDKKIKDLFRKTLEKIDRPIVIYISSKFNNNQYFGTKIIEEALKWE